MKKGKRSIYVLGKSSRQHAFLDAVGLNRQRAVTETKYIYIGTYIYSLHEIADQRKCFAFNSAPTYFWFFGGWFFSIFYSFCRFSRPLLCSAIIVILLLSVVGLLHFQCS